MVVDPQATTGIHELDPDAVAFQFADEFAHRIERRPERFGGLDLGTDVHADANRVKVTRSLYFLVNSTGSLDVDPELVFAQSGGYIRMRLGEDVRVHAQGDTGGNAPPPGALGEQSHFGFTLGIENQNPGGQSQIDLLSCLAHTREDHSARPPSYSPRGGEEALRQRRYRIPNPDPASSLRMDKLEFAFTE